ncbi:hypothetical protein DQ04_11451020 [Trypanosoma grayi]|uniref:hypothetical protein n=1 Tax=Trypanosoma grayi TaxID=71804 RepID=UPI0004F428F9|nr:hypothetical protein DQ04_11451020 [Trypanosoma grayi]KEG06967.1 hypothetical protein DQ04_11451020 [Trypanosoma grayi]
MEKDLIIAGGHKGDIQRGPRATSGSATIVKRTTAWEVLMYLGMALRVDEAMCALAVFVPPLVAVLPPAKHGTGDWMRVDSSEDVPFLVRCHQKLQQASAETHGYNELMDAAVWGICLIDVTDTLRKPCVADFKVGFVRHSPHTPAEKVMRISRKRLVQPHALRLCGAHHRYFHCPTSSDVACLKEEVCGKDVGYALETEEEYRWWLRAFFSCTASIKTSGENLTCNDNERVTARSHVCRQHLQKLLVFFNSSLGRALLERTALVSTSLLLIYDAADGVNGKVDDCEGVNVNTDFDNHCDARVYLIDFARSSRRRLNFAEEKVGFVQGLENMVHLLL